MLHYLVLLDKISEQYVCYLWLCPKSSLEMCILCMNVVQLQFDIVCPDFVSSKKVEYNVRLLHKKIVTITLTN